VAVSVAVDGDRRAGSVPVVVVVDAGHGGRDPGALGAGGVCEKDITLAIARRVALEAAGYPNLCIVLTRADDTFIELKQRLAIARAAHAGAYVSIHLNAASDPEAQGAETYPSGNKSHGAASLKLAQALQSALVAASGERDRGVRRASFYIDSAAMPAALVEVGFITRKAEAKSLQDPAVQQRIAVAILNAISQSVGTR